MFGTERVCVFVCVSMSGFYRRLSVSVNVYRNTERKQPLSEPTETSPFQHCPQLSLSLSLSHTHNTLRALDHFISVRLMYGQ